MTRIHRERINGWSYRLAWALVMEPLSACAFTRQPAAHCRGKHPCARSRRR